MLLLLYVLPLVCCETQAQYWAGYSAFERGSGGLLLLKPPLAGSRCSAQHLPLQSQLPAKRTLFPAMSKIVGMSPAAGVSEALM